MDTLKVNQAKQAVKRKRRISVVDHVINKRGTLSLVPASLKRDIVLDLSSLVKLEQRRKYIENKIGKKLESVMANLIAENDAIGCGELSNFLSDMGSQHSLRFYEQAQMFRTSESLNK
jgi:hypothetical protein